ncbi:MAG: glycosyltransferase family 4 protein [Candidatus Omnitrophica bacterium]|nr:glycosyltransferase family 4 protein [Candidatus Omnitrophota bacterium]
MELKLKKDRIVFLEDSCAWGGVQKWILSLAEGLRDYGWDITIATPPKGELAHRATKSCLDVFPVKLNGTCSVFNLFALMRFIKYLKKNNVKTLFLNGSKEFKFGGLSAYFAKTKKVIYRRGAALPIANRWDNRFFVNKVVSFLVTNSQSSKNRILKNGKNWLNQDKIRVIYNGVDLSIFNLKGEIAPISKEFNIPNDYIKVVCIGRLTEQKGYPFIIEAISRVSKSFNKIHVIVVGDGHLRSKLQHMVEDRGLSNMISFAGFRGDIASILRACDFMLHTPLWEGAPNVILEAMACGKPVVSWDVDGIGELMENNLTGYFSKEKDIEKLTANIQKMISDISSSKIKQMGEYARKRAEEHFSLKKMIKEYIEILK